jgi:hypothetical protein
MKDNKVKVVWYILALLRPSLTATVIFPDLLSFSISRILFIFNIMVLIIPIEIAGSTGK